VNRTLLVCLSSVFALFLTLVFPGCVRAGVGISPDSLNFGSVAVNTSSSAATVVVTNDNRHSLTIESISSSLPEFVVSGITLPFSVSPQSTTSFSVTFVPNSAQAYSGRIQIVIDSRDSVVRTISVSGTGVAPPDPVTYLLSSSTSNLAFGSILVGSASSSQSITLTNTGSGTVTISQVASSNAAFKLSGFSASVSLSPGQSLPLALDFAPSVVGSATGSLTVSSNATNSPTTIALSGTGMQPLISVTPTSVAFGNVTDGITNSQTVTITNPGSANLTLTQATVSGNVFAESGLTLPLTIAPGSASAFTVSFAPTSAGAVSGSVTLANNSPSPSLAISVSGTGVAQTLQLSASPSSLSFGSVTTGSSASQTVTLTNSGNASVALSNSGLTGTGFAVSGLALPLTLSPGQSTSFNVTFAPTATGSVSGSITVTSNATNSPTAISLSGTGAAPATYSVTLSWTPSSSSYSGFNVYRSTVSGGPYTKIDTSMITSPTYTDNNVTAGSTYYYVATQVDSSGNESAYSAQVSATTP
jgi:hypothetical protein